MSTPRVHPQSSAGYNTGKSELYDKLRPSYPPEVLSHIRKAVHKDKDLNIVEIGSGTGIFTRALLAHPEWSSSVAELKAFEPNEGMREVFSQTINDPRVSVAEGAFESTGAEDGWADLIVIATAFHWCLDLEGAINEFVRILRPGGTICFLWNPEDRQKAAWMQQCWDVVTSYNAKDSPFQTADGAERWRGIFAFPAYKDNFGQPEVTTIYFNLPATMETVIERCFTGSALAILPEDEKDKVRETLRIIVRRGDGMVWVDEKARIFEVPYAAPIVIMQRNGA